MSENSAPVETRLTALEARLAQQEMEISRLRHMLARIRQRGWLLALAGVVGLLAASAAWMMPALAQGGKEGGGTVGLAGTGSSVLLGVSNAASTVTDTTSINDVSLVTLMARTFRIANRRTAEFFKKHLG